VRQQARAETEERIQRIQAAAEDFQGVTGSDRAPPAVPRAEHGADRDDRAHAVTPDEQRQLGRASGQGCGFEIQVIDEVVEAIDMRASARPRAVAALIVGEGGDAAARQRLGEVAIAAGVFGEAVNDEQRRSGLDGESLETGGCRIDQHRKRTIPEESG
jgi:hypothetical protein